MIPGRLHRLLPPPCDHHLYRARHLVENTFATLKRARRIATRDEHPALPFAGSLRPGLRLLLAQVILKTRAKRMHLSGGSEDFFSPPRSARLCQRADLVFFAASSAEVEARQH